MKKRDPNNAYERKHLVKPSFLERFFQKRYVWLAAVVLITLLFGWGFVTALWDVFGLSSEPTFDFWEGIMFIAGAPFVAFLMYQEYGFYEGSLWSRDSKEQRAKGSTSDGEHR